MPDDAPLFRPTPLWEGVVGRDRREASFPDEGVTSYDTFFVGKRFAYADLQGCPAAPGRQGIWNDSSGFTECLVICRSDKAIRPPSDIFTIVGNMGTGDR